MTPDIARRIAQTIATEIGAGAHQVAAAVGLLDEGATVPFVARYRKEVTGGLDDTQLRTLAERLAYLREMEARRAAIVASIAEQGKMTDDLALSLAKATTKAELEDIYLPYKPKRRTRAMIARENGLQPLLDAILADRSADPAALAAAYVTEAVPDAKSALEGARDILAEGLSENADLLGRLRGHMKGVAKLSSTVVAGKEGEGAEAEFPGGLDSTGSMGSCRSLASSSPPTSACAAAPSAPAGEQQQQQQPAPAFGPPPLGTSVVVKVRRQGSVLYGGKRKGHGVTHLHRLFL